MKIAHVAVDAQALPPDKKLPPVDDIVVPRLVFQELFAHEKHWDAGRGEKQCCHDTGAAPRIPRAGVRRVGKPGNTRCTGSIGSIVPPDDVMIFQTLVGAPRAGEGLRWVK